MAKKLIQVIMPDRIKNPVGGLGVQLRYMMEHLKDDFDFDIIAQPENNGLPNYASVFNPLPSVNHASLVTIAGQMAYLAVALKGRKPDIVHAYDWSTYFAGAYAAEILNVPLIVTMQLSVNLLEQVGISYVNNPTTPDGAWMQRMLCEMELYGMRKAKKIVQVSEGYRGRFRHFEDFDSKTSVVPNGIELSEWQNVTPMKLPGDKPIKVIYIGRMALMKGVMPLCEAVIPQGIDLIFIGSHDGGEGMVYERMLQKTRWCFHD